MQVSTIDLEEVVESFVSILANTNTISTISMSLLFTNQYLPKDYNLSFVFNKLKPNYTAKVVINLSKNINYSNDNTDDNKSFSITLNTTEIISISSVLKYSNKSYKLKAVTNKENESTKYFTDEIIEIDNDNITESTQFSLEISFIGSIRKILTYNDVTKGVFSTKYTDPSTGKSDLFLLSTHSQPHFARYIFPCLDIINWKCPISLTLTLDSQLSCVSNLPIESSNYISESSNKVVKFETSPPMSTSLFSFSIGNMEYIENIIELPVSMKSFPIRIYTMIGDSSRADYALSIVSSAIVQLEKKFNVNYPLPKLDIMAIPFLSDGGVENWSMIQVINDHILLPDWKVNDDQLTNLKKTIRDVLVHEIVHMYVGNLITFESYDHTWMNESFATFMSNTIINELFDHDNWYKIINNDLTNLKNNNMQFDTHPIFTSNVKSNRIHDTFPRNSYEKGIFVIRTLASLFVENFDQLNNENYDKFFLMIGDFIKINQFKSFKPIDLWNFLKSHEYNHLQYDIPTIMNSWIRTPGFPILSITKDESGKFKIEQHRCLDYPETDLSQVEDIPFQIPLLIKSVDDKLARQFMTDRTLIINDDTINDDFLFINANESAIANIIYPESVSNSIATNITKLNKVEQMQFFKTFGATIGSEYQTKDTIVSFFKAIKLIKKSNKVDKVAFSFALSILSNLHKSIATLSYFEDAKFYKKINLFVDELTNKYISQYEWENLDWSKLTTEELKLRNSILSLKYDNSSAQSIGLKLFKKIMHGPKDSVPVEILGSVFNIFAQSCNLKDYKEINKLVRNPGLVVKNILNGTDNDVQTAAINSLGFMKNTELIYKTLNFVTTNPDVKMIELALLGLRFQMSSFQELWKWYLSHYTVWYSKYARDSNSYQGLFFKHVTELALECAYYDPSLRREVEKFISSRHEDVKTWFEEAKDKYENIKLLNEANSELKNFLQ